MRIFPPQNIAAYRQSDGASSQVDTHSISVSRFSARLLGKPAIVQRLCESLQVDIEKTRDLLGWQPPVSVDEALHKTVHHFLEHQQ